jgi:hypothetical protein
MNQPTEKTTLKAFVLEFELRKQYTNNLSRLKLKKVRDFRTARLIMFN